MQGRGDAADRLVDDALRAGEAGAFAIVMEMVPADVAARVTEVLRSRRSASAPARTATRRCWSGRTWPVCAAARWPAFVKQYADLRGTLMDAAKAYAADVGSGMFPAAEQSFD